MGLTKTGFAVLSGVIMFGVGFAIAPIVWGAVAGLLAIPLDVLLNIQTTAATWQPLTPIVGIAFGATFGWYTYLEVSA